MSKKILPMRRPATRFHESLNCLTECSSSGSSKVLLKWSSSSPAFKMSIIVSPPSMSAAAAYPGMWRRMESIHNSGSTPGNSFWILSLSNMTPWRKLSREREFNDPDNANAGGCVLYCKQSYPIININCSETRPIMLNLYRQMSLRLKPQETQLELGLSSLQTIGNCPTSTKYYDSRLRFIFPLSRKITSEFIEPSINFISLKTSKEIDTDRKIKKWQKLADSQAKPSVLPSGMRCPKLLL